MNAIINILETHPLFRNISVKALMELTQNAAILALKAEDTVYKAQSPSDSAYIVLEGACEALIWEKKQPTSTYGVGALFGEKSLLQNAPRRHTAVAITDSKLLRLDGEQLRKLLTENERLTNALRIPASTQKLRYNNEKQQFVPSEHCISLFVNFTEQSVDHSIIKEICKSIHKETKQSVLLLHISDKKDATNLETIKQRINELRSESHSGEKLPLYETDLQLGHDDRAFSRLVPFFETCASRFPYIIGILDGRNLSASKIKCVKHADNAYLLVDTLGSDLFLAKSMMEESNGHDQNKYRPVLLLKSGQEPHDLSTIQEQIAFPIRHIIRQDANDILIPAGSHQAFERERRYHAQFRRLSREIAQRRIGLVLSSGAAKGLAHIGVIQILEENGIEIDAVAGSSIGSYVGACWASGYNGKALQELSMAYKKRWGTLQLIDPCFPPRKGAIYGKKVERRLKAILKNANYADLSIPLRVAAVATNSLESKIFAEGDVASSVCASCTLPGICVPYTIDSETYLDGGLSNPLPVDALQNMGIERIIAVSTVMTPDNARKCTLKQRRLEKKLRWYSKWVSFINKHVNYFAPGNVFDTLMRSIEASQIRLLERDALQADVLIQPIACDAIWHDFANPEKYIELGRESARSKLSSLKQLQLP